MPCLHKFPSQALFYLAQWATNLDVYQIDLGEGIQVAWKHIVL